MDNAAEIRADLQKDLRRLIGYTVKRAHLWAATYYISRGLIIVLSAFTSAKAIGVADVIGQWQGVSAFIVTVLAASDTWPKPAQRFRTHYEYDDEYRRLEIELNTLPRGGGDEVAKLIKMYRPNLKTGSGPENFPTPAPQAG